MLLIPIKVTSLVSIALWEVSALSAVPPAKLRQWLTVISQVLELRNSELTRPHVPFTTSFIFRLPAVLSAMAAMGISLWRQRVKPHLATTFPVTVSIPAGLAPFLSFKLVESLVSTSTIQL